MGRTKSTPATVTVCGTPIQIDRSGGQGHCWVPCTDVPANVVLEIEGEMIDGGRDSHEGYRASNGQYYRW